MTKYSIYRLSFVRNRGVRSSAYDDCGDGEHCQRQFETNASVCALVCGLLETQTAFRYCSHCGLLNVNPRERLDYMYSRCGPQTYRVAVPRAVASGYQYGEQQ